MKSYNQYCSLALALDRIGGRWTLLIVRELLTGPKRFTDLMEGLPGIATNLLTGRLRGMEEDGLVKRDLLPPPANIEVYSLTEIGMELEEPVFALLRWAGRWMQKRYRTQEFRAHWLVPALRALFEDRGVPSFRQKDPRRQGWDEDRPDEGLKAVIEVPEGRIGIFSGREQLEFRTVPPENPAVIIRGQAQLILGLAADVLSWEQAAAAGLSTEGDERSVQMFRRAFTGTL